MVPAFSDFLKSLYCSNTYLPPVELSKKWVSSHLLSEKKHPNLIAEATRLTSDPEVQRALAEPLSSDFAEAVPKRNEILLQREFKVEHGRDDFPFYNTVEHDDLPGWMIKSAATRVPKREFLLGPSNDRNDRSFFTEEEVFLEIEMGKWVQEAARKEKIDIVIPDKKLVPFPNVDKKKELSRRYFLVSEKINVLSAEETLRKIETMDPEGQKKLAKKISTVVKAAGFACASFNTIRLDSNGRIVFVSTEPAGLIIKRKPGLWSKFFHPNGTTIEASARIGLYVMMQEASERMGGMQTALSDGTQCSPRLKTFHDELKLAYEKSLVLKLSRWKVLLSVVSFGLFLIVNIIRALARKSLAQRTLNDLKITEVSYRQECSSLTSKYQADQHRLAAQYQEKKIPLLRKSLACTQGVPYISK